MELRSNCVLKDLERPNPNIEKAIRYVYKISHEIKRQFLITNMLIEKIKIQDRETVLELCDIDTILTESLKESYFEEIELHKVRINIIDNFIFSGDMHLMKHVFLNLLQNSLTHLHNKSQGIISITTQSLEKYNSILFFDNGPGIPNKILSKIFKPFVRGTNGGCGLGIYFCEFVIEKILMGK